MRIQLVKIALLFTVFVLVANLSAQDVSSMTGVVTDSTGAVIPGAVVTLSNPSTGLTFSQTTDSRGSYRFANVPPTTGYRVNFSHEGFSIAQVADITLAVSITRTQNVALRPGNTETIVVSAGDAAVTLNTSDASIGNNMSVEQLDELPVYDRTSGISTLFTQQPGVESVQGAVTGARVDQTAVTLDGMDVNDLATAQTFLIVANAPVDSVEQFSGSVAGLVPSVGTGSGGQFQLVTKSGSNTLHGNVDEYHRDTTTVANDWFNNLYGIPRTPLIHNQFGGAIGGPIKLDKLFFFFDLGESRVVESASSEPIVPLAAFRSGTLNYINNGPGCGDSSRLNTQPSCISTLSAGQVAGLDPAAIGFNQSVLTYIDARYPEANDLTQGDGVNTGGYRFTTPTPDNEVTYVGRVDYHLTPTQRLFARATLAAVQTQPMNFQSSRPTRSRIHSPTTAMDT